MNGPLHASSVDDVHPRRDAVAIEIATLPRDAPLAEYEALTTMLHRAYRGQVELGLRPLAGRQTPEITVRRCRTGETFVARRLDVGVPASELRTADADRRMPAIGGGEAGGTPAPQPVATAPFIGMILFEEQEEAAFPAWFLRPEVAHFSLFAVDSDAQGLGIGARLLEAVDRRAAELGFRELALSMAEPDTNLIAYYRRRGFRFVQHWRWPYTNYRSAILSRGVGDGR